MIRIAIDITTHVARLSTTAIKMNADVPVVITFSGAPGEVGLIQLGLGTDSDDPKLLAFTQDFSEENATTWKALLDTTDDRLIAEMAGKSSQAVNLELALLLDGERIVCPHLSVTVQRNLIGPGTLAASGDTVGTGDGDSVGTGDGDTPVLG